MPDDRTTDGWFPTPLYRIGDLCGNALYVKRDDLIPYSFGGNKVRKALLFFDEIDRGGYDHVVTYGSSHSNHCRVVANMAARRGLGCTLVSPREDGGRTFNSLFMELFGARVVYAPVAEVHDTIESVLADLRAGGGKPYFIQGGGHGDLGTEAYVRAYREIEEFERREGVGFDYIFHASGTGATQAGLVCGKLMSEAAPTAGAAGAALAADAVDAAGAAGAAPVAPAVVGISVARRNPRGRDVVVEGVRSYMAGCGVAVDEGRLQDGVVFLDDYVGAGYASQSEAVLECIRHAMVTYGIPLDSTYTGKAFHGMTDYLASRGITGKNVLFIHTGGTPLFFDDMSSMFGGGTDACQTC